METSITRTTRMIELLNGWLETQIEENHQTRLRICELIKIVLAIYHRSLTHHQHYLRVEHQTITFSDLDLAHYRQRKSWR